MGQKNCKSSGNNIEQEAKLVDELLTAAKCDTFDRVWEIIGEPDKPKNAHLLNCIPDNRRWGVLHQAILSKNPEVLKKLLRFPACDSDMRTKNPVCTSDRKDTSGQCALELSDKEMRAILVSHKNNTETNRINEQEIPTFQHESYLGLACITLATYKSTFHPEYICKDSSVIEVLRKVFGDIETIDARYEAVKKHVCDAMNNVSIVNAKLIHGAISREDFYKLIIQVYTTEQHFLYAYVNTTLRRQKGINYCPTGDDLALGPYAIMFQMLLLFWNNLTKETGQTYRQVHMKQEDINKYIVGVVFFWPAIVSSTTVKSKAQSFPTDKDYSGDKTVSEDKTVLFVIDNTTTSLWSPKNIEEYALLEENERTYPAGAKFEVTKSQEKYDSELKFTQVNLKLLAQDMESVSPLKQLFLKIKDLVC